MMNGYSPEQLVEIFLKVERDPIDKRDFEVCLFAGQLYYECPLLSIGGGVFYSEYEIEFFLNMDNFSYFEHEETPSRWGKIGIKMHDEGGMCFYLNSDTEKNKIDKEIWSTILKKAAYQASLEKDSLKKFKAILDTINESLSILSL